MNDLYADYSPEQEDYLAHAYAVIAEEIECQEEDEREEGI
jgi:hypothetical protein